jgi:hypothetical protein
MIDERELNRLMIGHQRINEEHGSDVYWYHATSLTHADSIMVKGISVR